MTTEWVRSDYKKYQDMGLLYDHDNGNQRLIRIRIINEPLPSTPIPSSLVNRFVTDVKVKSIAKKPDNLTFRKFNLCYYVDNKEFSRSVISPFNTFMDNRTLYNELISGNYGFLTIEYNGEQIISNFNELMS
jgi:hypothetical protein